MINRTHYCFNCCGFISFLFVFSFTYLFICVSFICFISVSFVLDLLVISTELLELDVKFYT